MSGHSKWSTIKRQKGITDAKRGAVFTRLGNMIAISAKGGSDPTMNAALAMAIEKAKSVNMPMVNIERAIKRVTDKSAATVMEVLYEGYGPNGVAILVECATDNLNRTLPEVKHAFTKHGGSIAEKGAVSFLFKRRGMIRIKGVGEELLLKVIDAGADDAVEEDDETIVYTDPKKLGEVREALKAADVEVVEAELTYIPNSNLELKDQTAADKVIRLLESLEDLEDVVNTYTNFEI